MNISLLKLFLIILKINTITFGGGYTIVPVLRDEFVNRRKLIEDRQMIDLITIAQSSPGALAINSSLLIGYKLKNIKGAFVSALAGAIPCIIIISIVSILYSKIKDNEFIKIVLESMSGAISAVLISTAISLMKISYKNNKAIAIFIFLLMIIMFKIMKLGTIYCLIAAAIIGILKFRKEYK
ncbi:MAG: chromate transporter [Tissierellia bacterium]|nr:chromate transporter [Tissierellia bacterium]